MFFERLKKTEGQGLIEVLVAITTLTVVAAGLLVAVTVSLRNVEFAKKKALASICVQGAIEEVRYERDTSVWQDESEEDFYNFVENGIDGWWAFSEDLEWAAGEPALPNYQSLFKRKVHFQDVSGMVQVMAICSWTDGSREHKSKVITNFSEWK